MLFRIRKTDYVREIAGEFFGPHTMPSEEILDKARTVVKANGFGPGEYFVDKWFDHETEDGGWNALPPFEITE